MDSAIHRILSVFSNFLKLFIYWYTSVNEHIIEYELDICCFIAFKDFNDG